MLSVEIQLPACRPELLIRPLGGEGQHVVKDPATGAYFHLGAEEHFLLTQLDGRRNAETIGVAFTERFGQALADEELQEFLDMASTQGLLLPASGVASAPRDHGAGSPASSSGGAPQGWSILQWRKRLFDPDRLCTWLEPKLWFFWTRGFMVFSAGCILLAILVLWTSRHEAASSFASALRWETAVWVWLTLFIVTMLHEFAHGLTCKHHGGEVHEIGFLLLFFMPCFYCNVSDAWLFKEKSKRLWVTFAGGYFELFLWALAVFTWRLTLPGSFPSYLAFVVVAACGVQTLFNFNPLLKLDGYYLLSDWLEVPNLQQRALGRFKHEMRRLLWGAPRPENEARGRLLLSFGLVTWLYSVVFLVLMLWALFQFVWRDWGWLGAIGVVLLGFTSTRGLFQGFTAGEVMNMITMRSKRTIVWLLALGGLAEMLSLVEMPDRVSGSFRLRPASRAELRAPIAGFLKVVYADEGDRVSLGALVAQLEVPDLDSRLAQKQAEVREARAKVRQLEIGPRPEELAEQRQRVDRARNWRDLAQKDLTRSRQAHDQELDRLDKEIAARGAERDASQDSYERAKLVLSRRVLSVQEYEQNEGSYRVSQARLAAAQSAKRAAQAKGTLEAEAELALREKELAHTRGTLRLLEAGTRLEVIEGERARLARLLEEVRHLEEQRQKQTVAAPVSGLVITPRLKEKVGQYFSQGDLIGVVEEPATLEAEITIAEQDMARIRQGQKVELKARALPFETCATKVERIAPAAGRGDVQSSVIVYCRLDRAPSDLRPEMTGQARVCTGRRPVGATLLDRLLRFLRTEFWW